MSELGTVEKKSLVARFAEENIVSVNYDSVNDRIMLTFIENGIEKSYSLNSDGEYKYPLMTLTVVNNRSSSYTITSLSTVTLDGIQRSPCQTAAETTEEFTSIYNSKEDGHYYVTITPLEGSFSDFVNCKIMSGTSNNLEILDPSIDASCTITRPA